MVNWVAPKYCCLKPSDGNEKREKRNRAGQLPGPEKRKQAPGKGKGYRVESDLSGPAGPV